MNGFEALELMKQGKRVFLSSKPELVFGLANGFIGIVDEQGCFVEDTLFNFRLEYEEYIEPKPLTGWERVAKGEKYVSITQHPKVKYTEFEDDMDDNIYGIANYFSTEEKAEEINFKQTLFRKLQRFSDENGGSEIDWNDENQWKYHIKYAHQSNRFFVDGHHAVQEVGVVYFMSIEIAKKAIKLFHDDLIKYFTHDWSEGNE